MPRGTIPRLSNGMEKRRVRKKHRTGSLPAKPGSRSLSESGVYHRWKRYWQVRPPETFISKEHTLAGVKALFCSAQWSCCYPVTGDRTCVPNFVTPLWRRRLRRNDRQDEPRERCQHPEGTRSAAWDRGFIFRFVSGLYIVEKTDKSNRKSPELLSGNGTPLTCGHRA